MILQSLAFKKGKEVAGHNIQSLAKSRSHCKNNKKDGTRYFTTEKSSSNQLGKELGPKSTQDTSRKQKSKRIRALDRDFFMSVLGSSATKREARSYLQRFNPSEATRSSKTKLSPTPAGKLQTSHTNGIRLGGFDGTVRAVAESPKFVQLPEREVTHVARPALHIALVTIRDPQNLDDDTLDGIGRTLSQLRRLGLISIVVVDCADGVESSPNDPDWRKLATQQANRVAHSIDINGIPGARLVDNIVAVSEMAAKVESAPYMPGRIYISMQKLLMTPLRRGIIPVIPSMGYTDGTQTAILVKTNEIVLALTRELAGLQPALPDEDPTFLQERLQSLRNEVSLDRLIILDPLGGIPALDLPSGYHIFLNMEQQFETAKRDLIRMANNEKSGSALKAPLNENSDPVFGSNPVSQFVEAKSNSDRTLRVSLSKPNAVGGPSIHSKIHLENLKLVRSVLSMLPPSSSALVTTPGEAANSGKQLNTPFRAAGVGTRRQRNPLIYNLLTDKPVFSSSLPAGRLGQKSSLVETESVCPVVNISPTTFAKHGMPVTIFPDPKFGPWEPPIKGKKHLTLTDSQVDLPRLVHLIEDSFNRKLDVEDYLRRVNGRIAGVIIAGQYEGGAILTWEAPAGVVDDGSAESRARMVPYLDKFAVLKRSQGSGGVADIVFKAMVRDCFPDGVVWRSRKDNPVNKWYFERSRGTWKLPNSNWTMFWTTLNLEEQTFLDYEGVCRDSVPSWADKKAVID